MDAKFIFALASFGLSAYAYYPYYKDVKSKKAHPTISTWLCWLAIDIAILAGMIAKQEVAIQMVAYTLGCLAILTACIQVRAPLGWWWLDTVCMVLIGLAIASWAASGDVEVAISISSAAFFISCVPMFFNIYQKPERETFAPWFISWTGTCFGMLAIPKWDITNAVPPSVFFIMGTTVVLLICSKFFRGSHGRNTPLRKMINQLRD